ncbi:unnamed protein product, partial [Natator depressus]
MTLLRGIIVQILSAFYAKGQVPVCEQPPDVDFGEIISGEKSQYVESDSVQYGCYPEYMLAGTERITCYGRNWMPLPKCLAPCTITKQQLEDKKLLLPSGCRHTIIILNDQLVEFSCREGYNPTDHSARKCVDGHIDFPLCISDVLGKCGPPPSSQNGDIISDLLPVYAAGSSVEYKCRSFHGMTGSKIITCCLGKWTAPPVCSEAAGKCGHPPAIDNGDVMVSLQKEYESGSRVRTSPPDSLSLLPFHLHKVRGHKGKRSPIRQLYIIKK